MTKKEEDPNGTGQTECRPHERGYFCWSPKPIPQCYVAFEFPSLCCEQGWFDLEQLYQFALSKKAGNASILSVTKNWSPNGGTGIVGVSFALFGNAPATLADTDSIALYYLSLLGY